MAATPTIGPPGVRTGKKDSIHVWEVPGSAGVLPMISTSRSGSPLSSTRRSSGSASARRPGTTSNTGRSEEHTSELQSRQYLVCRLLLEKKKKTQTPLRPVLPTTHPIASKYPYSTTSRSTNSPTTPVTCPLPRRAHTSQEPVTYLHATTH